MIRSAVLSALMLAPAATRADDDTVALDLASASANRRLPFDVPFVLEAEAPPGTSRVELRMRVAMQGERPADAEVPLTAVSGTDPAGRFRLQVPPLPADRDVAFDLAFERSLTEAGRRLFRQDTETLLRNEMAPGRASTTGGEGRLAEGLRVSFARALAEGRSAGAAPGERSLVTPNPLFDPGASSEQTAADLARLTRELRAARSGHEAAIRRHDETLASLTAAIAEIGEADALAALVERLEAQPEIDPRNPRSPLALSDEARALAAGETAHVAPIVGGGPAELAAAREAHRQTARALRELRDWTQALVVPGAPGRAHVDGLRAAGALSAAQLEMLARARSGSAFRRAESWALVLEDYTADAERALWATDRALTAMLAELEAAAAGVVVRERVTAAGSTAAGLYASLDLGLLYAFEVDGGAAYAALSLSLAPVNKAAPLRGASLRKRLSLILGLTLTDLRQEDDDRFENLIGERWNVVAGVGVRVTGSLRVGAGALLLLKNDPNPLVSDRSLGAVPYVSASLDVDVARLLGGGRR